SHFVLQPYQFQEYNSVATLFSNKFNIDSEYLAVDSSYGHINRLYPPSDIQICTFSDSTDDYLIFIAAVDSFLNDWYRLFSTEPFEIDTFEYTEDDHGHHGADIFIKNSYQYPLYSSKLALGSMGIRVNGSGEITYLRSTLIPQLPIPDDIIISLDKAKDILDGYQYTVYGWGGSAEERIFSLESIEETALEVFIDLEVDVYGIMIDAAYHLAWRVTSFDGDFLVDSQTGDVIKFIQGWIS
ncbi:MAG: hypothetical protein ACE5EE_11005, partial [Fidelibacterota bacterium]